MRNSKFFTVIFIICLLLGILGDFLHGKFGIISTTMVGGIGLSVLFLLWNRVLWKIKFWKLGILWELFGLYDYPNLNGKWIVSLRSSFDKNKEFTGEFIFHQNYMGIDGEANFEQTKGKFLFSKLIEKSGESGKKTWILVIGYENKGRVIDDLLPHKGYIYLELGEGQDILLGEYTTDGNRNTFGEITLKRKK